MQRHGAAPDRAEDIRRGLLVGASVLALVLPPVRPPMPPITIDGRSPGDRLPDFGREPVSPDVRTLVGWIAAARDNAGSAFVVVDKKAARLHLFDAGAHPLASSVVLLGAARGDDSVPGIGTRPIEAVAPDERTTPAGRFVAVRGRNARGEDVIWVDHGAAVSIHRVLTVHPQERRLERLASPSAADKRISYGCINVPAAFFERQLLPLFSGRAALVYVLPEVKTVQQVFAALEPWQAGAASARPALARSPTPGDPR